MWRGEEQRKLSQVREDFTFVTGSGVKMESGGELEEVIREGQQQTSQSTIGNSDQILSIKLFSKFVGLDVS